MSGVQLQLVGMQKKARQKDAKKASGLDCIWSNPSVKLARVNGELTGYRS